MCIACTDEDQNASSLQVYLSGEDIMEGGVIACAAGEQNGENALIFYYPEPGASNIRLYQTGNAQSNKDDFQNYTRVFNAIEEAYFNGYLGVFKKLIDAERWFIVTYEREGKIHVSNPIRVKNLSKPTAWSEEVTIDQLIKGSPLFSWEANKYGDNAIYFQVLTDANNDVLSATYTFENTFRYYDVSNVVLNITMETPPNLVPLQTYNFTLMDVSADNWVNWVIQKKFEAE